MFDQNGLSLEQAPPIHVVLRFFLVGSLWGIVAGVWLGWHGADALDPAGSPALILTHMLTLGVFFSFMLGAVLQMLPVLAGVVIRVPTVLAIRTQYPMMAGTVLLLVGFGRDEPAAYLLSGLLLLIGLLPALGIVWSHLLRVSTHTAASRGMAYALLSALIVLGLGVLMIGLRNGWILGTHYLELRLGHMGYGLLGWIALLIVSVAFQVVEMFYVTPPYPRMMTRWLTRGVAWLLVGSLLAGVFAPRIQAILLAGAMGLLALHGGVTLRRFSQRKRPLTDATVWFWRIGSAALVVSMIAGIAEVFWSLPVWVATLRTGAFVAFVIAIMMAMTYKIVPFLVWFHLSSAGYFEAPMMHEVIHPRYAMANLWIFLGATVSALAALVYPPAWSLAGWLLSGAFGWLGLGIYRGWHRYLHIERTGEKFSFDFPQI